MLHVVVLGSINMDVVSRVHDFPKGGETVHGFGTEYMSGGKGANQAIACSLAGANVTMIGAVGRDAFSGQLRETLQSYGVNTESVLTKEGASGMAFIAVNDHGENTIILSKGANGQIDELDMEQALPLIDQANILLLQNEIPWEVNLRAMEEANRRGVYTMLNPAPAREITDDVLAMVDLLIVNETEMAMITGMPVDDTDQVNAGLRQLIERGAREVILTMGDKGVLYGDAEGTTVHVPAFHVSPVDTTAAGDTFIGALAAVFREPLALEQKLTFAAAAAAIAVTRKGASQSIPRREEIEQLMQSGRLRS